MRLRGIRARQIGCVIAAITASLLSAPSLGAQAEPGPEAGVHVSARHNFRVVPVAEDLDHPW